MRLLIAIFLFLSLNSSGQVIRANPFYRPFAVASSNLLLDDYPGALVAYSLRKLDKDYTGSAIRVRESGSNTEQDINFLPSGELDTASLKSFCGSNSGFVVTWYSQTGSLDATQSTQVSQPRIVNAGVVERNLGKPALWFDGSNDFLTCGNSTYGDTNGEYTCFAVAYRSGTSGVKIMLDSDPQTGTRRSQFLRYNASDASAVVFVGATPRSDATANITSDGNYLITSMFNNSNNLEVWYNNTSNGATATGGAINKAAISPTIGKYFGTNSGYHNSYLNELVFYASEKGADRTNIQSNINIYYTIY